MVDRSNLKLNDTIEREIEIWRGTVHGQAVWSMYHNGSSYESICLSSLPTLDLFDPRQLLLLIQR